MLISLRRRRPSQETRESEGQVDTPAFCVCLITDYFISRSGHSSCQDVVEVVDSHTGTTKASAQTVIGVYHDSETGYIWLLLLGSKKKVAVCTTIYDSHISGCFIWRALLRHATALPYGPLPCGADRRNTNTEGMAEVVVFDADRAKAELELARRAYRPNEHEDIR